MFVGNTNSPTHRDILIDTETAVLQPLRNQSPLINLPTERIQALPLQGTVIPSSTSHGSNNRCSAFSYSPLISTIRASEDWSVVYPSTASILACLDTRKLPPCHFLVGSVPCGDICIMRNHFPPCLAGIGIPITEEMVLGEWHDEVVGYRYLEESNLS